MARIKRSDAQEKRLAKLREKHDPDLKVSKMLPDGTCIFRYVKSWQRGWAKGVSNDDHAYTYAMDTDGNVFGYCWTEAPKHLAEYVTYPEARKARTKVETRKPASGKKGGKTAKAAVATPKKKAKVIAEDVALPSAA